MTDEEVARFELVLREAERIRQEIALEALYTESEGIPYRPIHGPEHSRQDGVLLAA